MKNNLEKRGSRMERMKMKMFDILRKIAEASKIYSQKI